MYLSGFYWILEEFYGFLGGFYGFLDVFIVFLCLISARRTSCMLITQTYFLSPLRVDNTGLKRLLLQSFPF